MVLEDFALEEGDRLAYFLFGCFDFLLLSLDVWGRFVEVDRNNSGAFVFLRSNSKFYLFTLLLWARFLFFFLEEVSRGFVLFLIKVILRDCIMQRLLQPKYILLNAIQSRCMMRMILCRLCFKLSFTTKRKFRGFRYTTSVVFSAISERLLHKLLKLEQSSPFSALRGSSNASYRDSFLVFLWLAHKVRILLYIAWVLLLQNVLLAMSVIIVSWRSSVHFVYTYLVDPSLG